MSTNKMAIQENVSLNGVRLHTSLKLGHTLTVSTDLFQELTTHVKIYAKACEYTVSVHVQI